MLGSERRINWFSLVQFQSLLQQQLRAVKFFKDVDKIEAVKCHRQQKAMLYFPSELFSLGRSSGRKITKWGSDKDLAGFLSSPHETEEFGVGN